MALTAATPPATTPDDSQVGRTSPHRWIFPAKAIRLARDAAPVAVAGVFVMKVEGTGSDRGTVFLNSKADYKDPACLTIRIQASLVPELEQRFGGDLQSALKGKRVVVAGAAKRIPIHMESTPRKVEYYQTQVVVVDAREVRIVPDEEQPPADE